MHYLKYWLSFWVKSSVTVVQLHSNSLLFFSFVFLQSCSIFSCKGYECNHSRGVIQNKAIIALPSLHCVVSHSTFITAGPSGFPDMHQEMQPVPLICCWNFHSSSRQTSTEEGTESSSKLRYCFTLILTALRLMLSPLIYQMVGECPVAGTETILCHVL